MQIKFQYQLDSTSGTATNAKITKTLSETLPDVKSLESGSLKVTFDAWGSSKSSGSIAIYAADSSSISESNKIATASFSNQGNGDVTLTFVSGYKKRLAGATKVTCVYNGTTTVYASHYRVDIIWNLNAVPFELVRYFGEYEGAMAQYNCNVYYYTGSSFEPCTPYYYDGTSFVLCDSRVNNLIT